MMRISLRKGIETFSFIFIIICLLPLSLFLHFPSSHQFPVRAESVFYSFHPGFGEATIDGYIDEDEWGSADFHESGMPGPTPSSLTSNGTLYVMQSATDLYFGFLVHDSTPSPGNIYDSDFLTFFFDDNNSGMLYEAGENGLQVSLYSPILPDPIGYNDMFNGYSSSVYFPDDSQPGGTTDGEVMSGNHSGANHFEVRFPLCSGDDYDFCLTPGDIIGLRLEYTDKQYYDTNWYFYPGFELSDLVTITVSGENFIFLPLVVK
jgi:hypothetical protein